MKVTVNIEFEGRDPIAEMVKFFGEPLAAKMGVAAEKATVAVVEEAKRPRGRPVGATKKATPEAQPVVIAAPSGPVVAARIATEAQPVGVVTPVAIEPTPAVVAEVAKPIGLSDVQAALEKLFNAKGVELAIGMLNSFGVARARDMKPEQYPAFMERVDMLMAAS